MFIVLCFYSKHSILCLYRKKDTTYRDIFKKGRKTKREGKMESTTQKEENKQKTTQIEQEQPKPAIAPGQMRVIKRNGSVVSYDAEKIAIAITKAFLAVEGGAAAASTRIHNEVNQLANSVTTTFTRRMPSGGTLHIEEIQDQVELELMRSGEQKVARTYVLYREERKQLRQKEEPQKEEKEGIRVTLENGDEDTQDTKHLEIMVTEACEGLEGTNAQQIIDEANKNLYDGVTEEDARTSLVMTSRTLVEQEANYTYVTARILLDNIRTEALTYLGLQKQATQQEMKALYPQALSSFLTKGVENEILNPELLEMDIEKLGKAIDSSRDMDFTYLGLQTLYDRYFIHDTEIRYELPQVFFMRVSMGLALREEKREEKAIEFYNLLSSFDYMSSTPTLFNSGTKHIILFCRNYVFKIISIPKISLNPIPSSV